MGSYSTKNIHSDLWNIQTNRMREQLMKSHTKMKKKTALGWVVNGGRRHAEQQGELIPRGYTK
jgi:hypothetical protein